ncbi:receptor-like protein 32 [Abrus precatorius]|uniref:Receptor-like protein 32 n=1 Tax=Abrus precatorius TaxID=3816 RepID=A0A8B8LA13_ABRPR|nr:receptor-like protein 32 [Abrus precatorius]
MRIPHVQWLSIIFCYCFWRYQSVDFFVVSAQIVEDQQQSLLKLKSELKFKHENSSKLVSWNLSIGCSQWIGVKCNKEGQVIGLDLSGESIYGGFDNSSSIFSLQNLQSLNLATNNFSSVIPSGLNKLKNLTYLNLSYAGFRGQIPIEISHLTRLVTLDISSLSYLYGQPLKLEDLDLGKLVQNLTWIRKLYMDGVSVTAQGQEWCKALLPLLSLEELSMSNCNLSGPLDHSLITLKNLSVIRLDQNNLSSQVPETFAQFPNLTTLYLSSCGLTGVFPEKIFEVATLSDIDISFNYDLDGSFPKFPLHGSLRSLVVRSTYFSGAIPASISNLKQLSILDLSNCLFNGTLPGSMSRLSELTYVDLSSNYFTGPIPSLNMSKNLFHLALSHNDLTGSIASLGLEGLRKLVQIDLQYNLLNGSIPSYLFTLPLLRSIRLSTNNFGGHLDEYSNISSSMLGILDLSSNNLEGTIPKSIFHLRSLIVLQLSSNKLNGTVKLDEIQSLENLTTIDLSYNNLSIDTKVTEASLYLYSFPTMSTVKLASCNLIKFPGFLKNQSKLTNLDLSNNLIPGFIPTWVWQLDSLVQLNLSQNFLTYLDGSVQNTSSTLKVLDLHFNQLQGKLPVFPGQVAYLDYSGNNFSFSIPSDFGTNLSSIIFLSLSRNYLTGSIPKSLCNRSNMLVLDVSYNHFEGKIPECLTQSETLMVLNLQHNNFSGSIPDTFPVSCGLRTLDLNSNLLRGTIPNSLANCTLLEVLDLGNNQVDDRFPCFLQKLHTFRVMVLRGNKFHGKCFRTWEAMMLHEGDDVTNFNRIGSPVLKFGRGIYYQDSVTLTSKGLYALNLSHNDLTGPIPSSIGNLKQLESLDLSSNHFDGKIPTQLASLSFLAYLNLSFNRLVGKIPLGTQLQTFEAASFAGNVELCGAPLTKKCSESSNSKDVHTDLGVKFDWSFISIGVGFGVGAGFVVAPLLFWERAKNWSNHKIDKILLVILPMVGLSYTLIDDDEADEDTKENSPDMEEESDYDNEEDNLGYQRFQGRYCVLCSKLNMRKKKAIHDPRCTCYTKPTISASTYPESYSSQSHIG